MIGLVLAHPAVDVFRIHVDALADGVVTARVMSVATGAPTTVSRDWHLSALTDWVIVAGEEPLAA